MFLHFPTMRFSSYTLPAFTFLLMNLISDRQWRLAGQTPGFDQALLPFGSQSTGSRFVSRCVSSGAGTEAGSILIVLNNCPFTVWGAAVPGGGRQLNGGEAWTLNIPSGTAPGRVWGRSNCSFDASGQGKCETGDCNGLLECEGRGTPPNTLVDFGLNQIGRDFFDVSLVEGFNIPIQITPTSNGCTRGVNCTADIIGQCPAELRAPGGCNNPCTVFKTDEYCCTFGKCAPRTYSRFFKQRCPDAYSIYWMMMQPACLRVQVGPHTTSYFALETSPYPYAASFDQRTQLSLKLRSLYWRVSYS